MSTPTNGAPYQERVVIELRDGATPRRVQVWGDGDRTFVSFPANMTETEAREIVARGRGLVGSIDVTALFNETTRKRFIDPGGE